MSAPTPKAATDSARARTTVSALAAVVGTIVWTHALAGALGHVPESAVGLTVAAAVAALAGATAYPRSGRAAALAGLTAALGTAVVALRHPAALVPGLALIPVSLATAAGAARLAARLPVALERQASRRPALAFAWVLVALIAAAQVGRLATYMTDADSDWFLSTRHPFYAKHECFDAYVFAAELDRRGEPNVYDATHYPGLNPAAEPRTEIRGMTPEDPFQYAPQFLLWPRLAIALTHDYHAIRMLWFGINVTLCMGAVLALSSWIGGRVGAVSALLSPLVLASFPVLHDFQYGQFHFAAIALACLGLWAFSLGRRAVGGTLLAVAILSKLFPVFLLVPLAARRRWRELGWTAVAGGVLTLLALAVVGPSPFVAFVDYQLPRLSDGQAFAFGEAWPEMASLVIAGNQGVQGVIGKLDAMGVPGFGAATAKAASSLFALALVGVGFLVGRHETRASRGQRVAAWLGLLGLASLGSAGAWADYVPLTGIWLLAVLAPSVDPWKTRPALKLVLAVGAAMQFFLLGTMPIGGFADPAWMFPLSLLGAATLAAIFGTGVWLRTPVPVAARDRAGTSLYMQLGERL